MTLKKHGLFLISPEVRDIVWYHIWIEDVAYLASQVKKIIKHDTPKLKK